MFNIGPEKFLIIAVVALIVLGPDKLPEAARTAGKFLQEARRMSSGFEAQVRAAMETQPHDDATAAPSASSTTATIGAVEPQAEISEHDHRVA